MAETFNKKEREKKRAQKRKEKQMRKEERSNQEKDSSLESMMAYVDEFGNIQDTPPDPNAKKAVKAKNIEIGVPKREKEEVDLRLKGKISFYDDAKGYGFIKTSDDESFFMHINHVTGDPAQGKSVTFEKQRGDKGWVAVSVKMD